MCFSTTVATGLLGKNLKRKSEVAEPVKVNEEQCQALGRVLAGYSFRDDFYQRPFLSLPFSPEEKARMYFFSVGICHQTWHLAHPAANLYGWDYLEDGFIRIFREGSWLSDPVSISRATQQSIAEGLASYFIPDTANVSTLDRIEERAALYHDMASKLVHNYKGKVFDLLLLSGGRVGGEKGFYQLFRVFEAYSDPLYKKTSFLLKLLTDASLFSVDDPENLIPVMDYHMQRVLLRSGAVEVLDPTLREALVKRSALPSDTLIREACINASKLVAASAGRGVLQMNDVLYMMGRSCCFEQPLCSSGRCAKQPCSLTRTLQLENHHSCIFSEVCRGASLPEYRQLWNPVVRTHYY